VIRIAAKTGSVLPKEKIKTAVQIGQIGRKKIGAEKLKSWDIAPEWFPGAIRQDLLTN
jgi:hypothetical protein